MPSFSRFRMLCQPIKQPSSGHNQKLHCIGRGVIAKGCLSEVTDLS